MKLKKLIDKLNNDIAKEQNHREALQRRCDEYKAKGLRTYEIEKGIKKTSKLINLMVCEIMVAKELLVNEGFISGEFDEKYFKGAKIEALKQVDKATIAIKIMKQLKAK